MNLIRRVYTFFFIVLNDVFKHSADSYHELKGILVLTVVAGLTVFKITYPFIENYFADPRIGIVIIFALFSVLNVYLFDVRKDWKRQESEFYAMSRGWKLFMRVTTLLLFLFIVWICFVQYLFQP